MNGITWLASYPKSGNTWLRVFLANLRAGAQAPVDINALPSVQFTTRELFDRTCGWKSSELLPAEVAALRLPVQRLLARRLEGVPVKTHEIFAGPDGRPRFAADAMGVILYVVRNPLDVAPSLAHHLGWSLDRAIAFMADPAARLAAREGGAKFEQPLGDWSAHVRSWTEAQGVAVCVLRYEDLLAAPEATFARVARAAGIDAGGDAVRRALRHSQFEELQRQEKEKGFAECQVDRPFFRKGRSGGWRETLGAGQIAAIIDAHGEMMRKFNYLTTEGTPV